MNTTNDTMPLKPFNFLAALLVILSALAITACNTVEGVGKDVQSAGDTIEDAADGD